MATTHFILPQPKGWDEEAKEGELLVLELGQFGRLRRHILDPTDACGGITPLWKFSGLWKKL